MTDFLSDYHLSSVL